MRQAPIDFVKLDAAALQENLITTFETVLGETLYPGDERRIFLLQMIPILLAMKSDINYVGNQNLLPFAEGVALDALGALFGVSRLPSTSASVSMKFVLLGAYPEPKVIPAGTKVTSDGSVFFETIRDLSIAVGSSEGEVEAIAHDSGSRYNGFLPGQITVLVDPIAYVKSVVNVTESSGGSDIESDDALRERIQLAPVSFSVAGPEGAYVYHAKSADANIADVKVMSSGAGIVDVYVLMKDGKPTGSDILDKVMAAVNSKERRPLTDYVIVHAPVDVQYDLSLTYYIQKERTAEVQAIRNAIEGSGGAIDQYIGWQASALNRNVNPDYLRSLFFSAGAFKVDIISPTFVQLNESKVGRCRSRNVTYGGLI